MRVQLTHQAKAILGPSDLVMITERVDDVALRIGQMVTRGLPEVVDRHLPRHGTQRGLSWGWTAVIWLASIVTEGDHRNVSVETSITGMHHTLRHLTAQGIAPLDLRDDRLSHRLHHVRKPASWHPIAHDWHARSLAV
jgi:transposase